MMLAMYVAQWEWQAANRGERQLEAEREWVTRALWLARKRQIAEQESREETSTSRRLWACFRWAGA